MARKPNYEFERRERERLKAIKVAEKAAAKREARTSGAPRAQRTKSAGRALPRTPARRSRFPGVGYSTDAIFERGL